MPLDAVGPYDVLRFLPGAETVFVATEAGPVRGSGGLTLHADAGIDDVESCDICLFPAVVGLVTTRDSRR